MDNEKIEYFRKKLYEEKENISEVMSRLQEDMGLGESLKDSTSELSSYDNHPGDIASETFEVEKNRALKSNEVTHLKMIDDALLRMDGGSYGICKFCGKEINLDRLEAVPFTDLCIDCESNEKPNYQSHFEKPNYKSYSQDRPIEETVIGYPFGNSNMDSEDYTGYDGEDTWQELESYNSLNYMLWDDEDENMQGIVEETDKISNEQYKRQLPD